MIESLRGILRRKDTDEAILEIQGICFKLAIPASTFSVLPEEGEEAQLHTDLTFNDQEGVFTLFGFATVLEREAFRTFQTISGIGPRKGLMILSQVRIAEFAQAIVDSNLAYLARIKGVGRKTAERLIVELREKMAPFLTAARAEEKSSGAPGGEAGPPLPPGQNIAEAVACLISLGCRYAQAARAVTIAVERLGASSPTAQLVKEALRHR